jgi:hypothetical protein
MSRDEDFRRRFPSYRPEAAPRVAPVRPPSKQERIAALSTVFRTALPHLVQYANFEPHASPVIVAKGRKRELTAGWMYNSSYYSGSGPSGRSPGSDPSTSYWLLTEEGLTGITTQKNDGAFILQKASGISERQLGKYFAGFECPEARMVAQNLSAILLAAGVEVTL